MLEFLGTGLFGSLLGGLFRLAPELLKFFTRKEDNKHELEMFKLQTDLEKLRGDFKVEEKYVDFSVAQLHAIQAANEAEGKIASQAHKWVIDLVSAVRPIISLSIFFLYVLIKITFIATGLYSGVPWSTVVYSSWTQDDFGILMMILTFHYVGRPIEKYQKGK